MKRIIKWIIIAAVIAGVGFAAWTFLSFNNRRTQAAATAASYETVKVERGSLASTILASGTVRAGQSAVLAWPVSGKVGKVNVTLGQTVKTDDVLAELDPTSLSQSLIQAQNDLITAQQTLQDLYDNSGTQSAQAESNLVAAQTAVKDAQDKRDGMNYPRVSDTYIHQAESDLTLAENKVSIMEDQWHKVENRDAADPVRAQALANLTNAQISRNKAQATLNWYRGKASTADLAQADADLAVAKAKLADAERQVEKTKSGPSAQDLQMAQNRVTIAQAAANQSRISAPFAGTVTDLSALKGDVVSPNTKLLRLDDLSSIYVDLQVTEVDVNKLQAGQAADVTLDAVPDGTYKAEVVEVGRVGATSGGVVYFTVTLRLKDADARVSPGMTASASITTASQENVLLVPNRAIRTTNSKSTVFIPGGQSGARPVSVQVGASNESMTIITSGLKEGELVITNPPSASTTTQASGFRGLFGGGGPRPSDTTPRSGATGGNQP